MFGRGGLGGLLLVIAILYFTGAGSWLWNKVQGLDVGCYSLLSQVSGDIAEPVCGATANAIGAIERAVEAVKSEIEQLQYRFSGSSGMTGLNRFVDSIDGQLSGLSSSGDRLSQMIQQGPRSMGAAKESFQQAVDSFTIGSNFLNGSNTEDALAWLRSGASQPKGYGVMSQLKLGSLYANGGSGVASNPKAAEAYLAQAHRSIDTLTQSNSTQARQLLQRLPGSPQQVQAEIEAALRKIRATAPN